MLHIYHIFFHAPFVSKNLKLCSKGPILSQLKIALKDSSQLNNVSTLLIMVIKSPILIALHVIITLDPRLKANWNNDLH